VLHYCESGFWCRVSIPSDSKKSIAGSDTTAAAISSILYLILTHPAVHMKLREELSLAALGAEEIPAYEDLEKIPYLRAIIDEGLVNVSFSVQSC
jgi:hypothetical protein